MTEPEIEVKCRSALPSPLVARRCRIPKLSRSSSVKTKGEISDIMNSRPLSLALPSKSKDYLCYMESRYPSGSMLSVPFQVEDDRSSLRSFGSFVSYNSYASQSQITEASVSRPVSRSHGKKYVLHCERHIGPTEEYLTPTQRKDREIRQLKSALIKQAKICEEKDGEVDRLKAEVKRLHDALTVIGNDKNESDRSSCESIHVKNSSSETSVQSRITDKSDFQSTVLANIDDSGISNDVSISPQNGSEIGDTETSQKKILTCDKSIFVDILDSSAFSYELNQASPKSKVEDEKQYVNVGVQTKDISDDCSPKRRMSGDLESFLSIYHKDLEQLKVQHKEYYQDLKNKFNDRVEDLMKKLSEANSRYFELRPLFDRAQDKIQSLENQLSGVQREMETQEEWHNQMYLKMYRWKSFFTVSAGASILGFLVYQYKSELPSLEYICSFFEDRTSLILPKTVPTF